MITERCPHCGNTVVGQFSPSATRKVLTTIAKKGGMKAVLAYVGSVIPVLGNIGGFAVGAALDIIYGDDIKKYIDKVADEFDDNKVYVFDCPKCGHSWARKEDEIEDMDTYDDPDSAYFYSEPSYSVPSSRNSSVLEEFNADFSEFLDEIETISQNSKDAENLANKLKSKGDGIYVNTLDEWDGDSRWKGAYYALAGMSDLLYAINNYYGNKNIVSSHIKRARKNLNNALHIKRTSDDGEIKLIQSAIETLATDTPQSCIQLGTKNVKYYGFPNDSLFNKEYIGEIYDKCRFCSIHNVADKILEKYSIGEKVSQEDDKYLLELWTSGTQLADEGYRMYCNHKLYLRTSDDKTSNGKLSSRSGMALKAAYSTPGYDINDPHIGNTLFDKWLEAYTDYAIATIKGRNTYDKQDIQLGMEMLGKVVKLQLPSDMEFYWPQYLACNELGELYEEGIFIEQDLEKALQYYMMSCEPEKEVIERVKAKIQKSHGSSNNWDSNSVTIGTSHTQSNSSAKSQLTSDEEEYLIEYKACLEDDGVITDRERRLLDRIRKSLGISEERARELEASCTAPSFTEEEQEYADEIRTCLEEGGCISDRERRLLNKLRISLGISEERANEIEALVK